jgi:hypothetical protein
LGRDCLGASRLGMVFFRYFKGIFEIARPQNFFQLRERKFFCFARRSEGETGGNAPHDSGFCSKKVRTSSKKHRQIKQQYI